MSHRLTGGETVIKVPSAEIVCDGPCGRSWPYQPTVIQLQAACVWKQTPDHYIVSARQAVGASPEAFVRTPEGKDICPDCVTSLVKK